MNERRCAFASGIGLHGHAAAGSRRLRLILGAESLAELKVWLTSLDRSRTDRDRELSDEVTPVVVTDLGLERVQYLNWGIIPA